MGAKKPLGKRLEEARENHGGVRHDLRDELDRRKDLHGSDRKASTRRIEALRDRFHNIVGRIRALRAQQVGRRKPRVLYTRTSPNQSSRGGVKPRLIVLHSTESGHTPGLGDLKAIADFFANPSVDASSHVITDADGTSARCVADGAKAWTCVNFNSVSLNIEQIGRASQGEWSEKEVAETARWIALWSKAFGIPLTRGAVSGSVVTKAGIVTHAQLGAPGGGHTDPGAGFPVDRCIQLARRYR